MVGTATPGISQLIAAQEHERTCRTGNTYQNTRTQPQSLNALLTILIHTALRGTELALANVTTDSTVVDGPWGHAY